MNVIPIQRKRLRLLVNYTKATWPKCQRRDSGESNHNPSPVTLS